MKTTSLNFITSFLFDDEIKNKVINYVYANDHKHGLRVTWKGTLQNVPNVLFCNEEYFETLWILIRNKGDVELRIVELPDPTKEIEFDKMPNGIQRAIAIFFPKDGSALGWRLFQNTVKENTSIKFQSEIKTFTTERIPANKVSSKSKLKL